MAKNGLPLAAGSARLFRPRVRGARRCERRLGEPAPVIGLCVVGRDVVVAAAQVAIQRRTDVAGEPIMSIE